MVYEIQCHANKGRDKSDEFVSRGIFLFMDDRQFSKLLYRFDYSWSGYRKVRKGVKKRLRRHMQDLDCRSVEPYLQILEHGGEQREHFDRLMTFSISRFFRDRALWHIVENDILPEIAERKRGKIKREEREQHYQYQQQNL